ncbi:hypothetical protein CHS0354_008634 [Potamilus streckersoni]|uniref:Uncharacterized protein n=1 Tax=Potamilus streckersoni TaxID=2493646 RepID=A0AAE0TI39_9BIVA|nr:hypothetical protein CHS0354_008634 [Potamilus streckersoni]
MHDTLRDNLLKDLSFCWEMVIHLDLIPCLEKSNCVPFLDIVYVTMNFLTSQRTVCFTQDRISPNVTLIAGLLAKIPLFDAFTSLFCGLPRRILGLQNDRCHKIS